MEVLILILVIAVVVGFFIVNDSGAKALTVIEDADRKDYETKTKEPVKKATTTKAKPANLTTTIAQKPVAAAGSKNNRNKRKKT
jgi:hypothetical protein